MIKVQIYKCIKEPELNQRKWNFKLNQKYLVKQSKNNLHYMIKNENEQWIEFYHREKLNSLSYLYSCFELIEIVFLKNYDELLSIKI